MKVILFIDNRDEVRCIFQTTSAEGLDYPAHVNVMYISSHLSLAPEWEPRHYQQDLAFEICAWHRSGGSVLVYESIEEAVEATEYPVSSYITRLL